MLLAFGFGVLVVIVSGFWALWHHGAKKNKAVLLLANGLPTARLEAALYLFAYRWMVNYCCWYVYLPQYAGLPQVERNQLLALLPARLGFSLLSTGECQRLWQDKNCQFYFLSSSGVFYRLNSKNGKDWERLLVL